MPSNDKAEYVVLDKDLLEQCFKDLAKSLRKRTKGRGTSCELIVVGGASVLLNYGFRDSTSDVDCTDEQRILMNDVVNLVAEKHNLPSTWINTDFMNSKSYSPALSRYSVYYRSYGNGALTVRTIRDEYLLAMKVVSGRKYKNDYSDIHGILTFGMSNNKAITEEMLDNAIVDLYGSMEKADADALAFAKRIIANPQSVSYEEIKQTEEANATLLQAKLSDDADKASIDYILSKLDLM